MPEQSVELQPEGPIYSIEEQLEFSDEQLATMAIDWAEKSAEKEMDSALRSTEFKRNYKPMHPGPRPHPEDGGMDHADWDVANHEYTHHEDNQEEAVQSALSREAQAEAALRQLEDDKQLIQEGDKDIIARYGGTERKRLQDKLELNQKRAESRAKWELYDEGTKIEGSENLAEEIRGFVDANLGGVRGSVHQSGWTFSGAYEQPTGRILTFERYPQPADGSPPQVVYQGRIEILVVGAELDNSDSGFNGMHNPFEPRAVRIEHSVATDVDDEAVRSYGTNIATIDYVGFGIASDGRVHNQNRRHGSVSKHLPNLMDNGTIRINNVPRTQEVNDNPRDLLNPEDLADTQAKVKEVADAMHELAANNPQEQDSSAT